MITNSILFGTPIHKAQNYKVYWKFGGGMAPLALSWLRLRPEQPLFETVNVICLCTRLLSWDLSCHYCHSLKITVLLLIRSRKRFRHCFFLILLKIAKTVSNTIAQRTVGQGSQTRGPQATCGQRGYFVRPVMLLGKFKTINLLVILLSLFAGV